MYKTRSLRCKPLDFDFGGELVLYATCEGGIQAACLIRRSADVVSLDISYQGIKECRVKWRRLRTITSLHQTGFSGTFV